MTDKPTVRPIYDEDWALTLERDYDDYMEGLYESADADMTADDYDDEHGIDITGNYFCGCSNCERRASWTFLMVRIVEAYRDGLITLEPIGDGITDTA